LIYSRDPTTDTLYVYQSCSYFSFGLSTYLFVKVHRPGDQHATRKYTMVGQKYFKEGGQTYTKYNKITNNSEN